ncbi:MAG: DegV family protein [Thermotogaceae bacterium]|nr:DegV family protein [Thermotogaceae bacterium]
MKKIKIIVDSTADLPEHFLEKYDIDVVPLYIIWPDGSQEKDTWLDEEKMKFYQRLMESEEVPDTSQPTVPDFVAKYKELMEKGYDEILVLTISTQMSGTFNSATLAAKEVEIPVYIFDTLRASSIVALMARTARLLANQGKDSQEIMKIMKERFDSNDYQAVFYVSNFEYLVKGGRINKFQGFLGSMLRMKVGIYIKQDGTMEPFGKARGVNKAVNLLLSKLDEAGFKEGEKVNYLSITAGAREEAEIVTKAIKEKYDVVFMDKALTGKVITKHVAPGMVGIALERFRGETD